MVIKISQNEFLALRLSHGMYEEANKEYLMQYNGGLFPMRTNLWKILHWADIMAASIEGDVIRKKYTR